MILEVKVGNEKTKGAEEIWSLDPFWEYRDFLLSLGVRCVDLYLNGLPVCSLFSQMLQSR